MSKQWSSSSKQNESTPIGPFPILNWRRKCQFENIINTKHLITDRKPDTQIPVDWMHVVCDEYSLWKTTAFTSTVTVETLWNTHYYTAITI